MSDVTRILSQIESGDPKAAEQLLPLVYEELRRLAKNRMANLRADQLHGLIRYSDVVDPPQPALRHENAERPAR